MSAIGSDAGRRALLGIGNPGREYAQTRHNIGFLVVDELHRRHGAPAWTRRFSGEACQVRIADQAVLLLKPLTFVNRSGESAQALLAFHKLLPEHLLVVVDDLNLPLGDLRLRPNGSSGGHNGLKDIEARIGPAYPRLRIGIGRQQDRDAVDHVLGRFTEVEAADVADAVRKSADCAEQWLREGCAVACRFNGPLRPPPPRPARPRPSDGTGPAASTAPETPPPDPSPCA